MNWPAAKIDLAAVGFTPEQIATIEGCISPLPLTECMMPEIQTVNPSEIASILDAVPSREIYFLVMAYNTKKKGWKVFGDHLYFVRGAAERMANELPKWWVSKRIIVVPGE